jgi:predicted Zn-dependent protease
MIAAMRAFGQGAMALAPIVGRIAVPVAEAICAHRRGDFSRAVDLMKPIYGDMAALGGSHAQQEVLEQIYLDAVLKAGRVDEARRILERAAAQRPLALAARVGYAQAARDVLD